VGLAAPLSSQVSLQAGAAAPDFTLEQLTPVLKRRMTGPISFRSLSTMTGVGIAKWNQLVAFGFPTMRVKKPKRCMFAIWSGHSTAMLVPWTHIACEMGYPP
jgi:hypothetical protein